MTAPEQSPEQRSALVLLQALDCLEAAAGAIGPGEAVGVVRMVVDELDDERVRAVAVALAVEAVWKLPPADMVPRTFGERRARLRQVRAWVRRVRLEAWWVVS